MKKERTSQSGLFNLRALLICVAAFSIVSGTLLAFFHPDTLPKLSQRTLAFAERVAYQHAIEDVYWRHRIWPKENSKPKLSLNEVMSQEQLEKKVADYLRKSQVLGGHWQRPMTDEQLQAEMDRMASHTKRPDVLRELFTALDNDPFVIAECLARPGLVERSILYSGTEQVTQTSVTYDQGVAGTGNYSLPTIPDWAGCPDDNWEATTTTNAPSSRNGHTTVCPFRLEGAFVVVVASQLSSGQPAQSGIVGRL